MSKASPYVAPDVYLAPMSGVTDAPFRAAVRKFGVGHLVSEMVASVAMLSDMRDTRKLRAVFDPDQPTILQLAGYDPDLIARGVEIACDRGARAIDLNFGCPARRVVGKVSGSALMRDEDLSERIFNAVGSVASVPWSVKMRLGWDHESLNASKLAKIAEQAGATRIFVHGRTRCQFYKGQADWAAVQEIVSSTKIPITVNGDIKCATDAAKAMKLSDAHSYMVGRATTGRPWLLKQMQAELSGDLGALNEQVQANAHLDLLEMMLSFYGTELGLKSYRKHFAAWSADLNCAEQRRHELLTTTNPADIFGFLRGSIALDMAA